MHIYSLFWVARGLQTASCSAHASYSGILYSYGMVAIESPPEGLPEDIYTRNIEG